MNAADMQIILGMKSITNLKIGVCINFNNFNPCSFSYKKAPSYINVSYT